MYFSERTPSVYLSSPRRSSDITLWGEQPQEFSSQRWKHTQVRTEAPFLHNVGRVQWRCDQSARTRAHACRRAYTGAHMGWEGENVKGGGGERETTAAKRKRKRKWRLVRMSKWGRPAQKSRSQNRNNTSAWSDKTRSKQLDYHCQKGKDQTLEAFFLIVWVFFCWTS